jgi:predicted membrane metal-binding protein
VHLTLGILRKSQAVFYAFSFFWLDGFAVPAPAQVTQTVGWLVINRLSKQKMESMVNVTEKKLA